ncbi:protein transport protein Sec16A isoform X3 [Trichosurus vulpecula]|uniref:protein transport protein Sec16A isoform X3 n=1 Tax=Trichosurus vulpecula TaxID=9337 RepID=UPI00186AEC06|nr:protein transport protein Sec16A isoform X3 [Trichosurus vulpecula]
MMQPPPQTVPSGTGGPPPVGGPRNMYWSNSPYSRRANAPVTAVAGPVQPVTDPFAFGRQTPQGTALGNPSKGNSLVMQGPSPPMFSQPPGMHVPHTHAGDNSQGLYTSLSGPVSQPGVNTDSFTNVLAPAVLPGHVMNSSAEIQPTEEPGIQASSVPSHYNSGAGLENSFGGHFQSGVPLPHRPLSRQDPNGGAPAPPTTASFFPQSHQQTPVQWRPVQGSPQSSVQNYSPYIEPPSQNAVPLASSHFLPQANMHQVPGPQQQVPLVSASGPLVGSERNEIVPSQSSNYPANNFQPENMFRQNPGVNSGWPSQDFRQNLGASKQQLPDPTLVNPIAQGNSLENQPQYRTEAVTSHVLPEANSGTIAMFFKGEEAENEENLSSEKADTTVKSDFDGFLPNSGHGGHHLPHPMQVGASVPFQASVPKGSANESIQQGIEAQQYFSQSTSNQHDKQTTKNCDIYVNDDKACTVKTCDAIGSQYENVENLECIQNQEVPPSEPPNLNPSSPNDQFRYGPLPAQSVSKHSISYAEGGPNLEAPDSIPHPVRSDSVSSNYSSVSHRSISSSTRPQESVGTFIQQEVGKPNEETSDSFFKQIDSSPLVGETNDNINKNYHSNLSQPPTPSPPKPTGIFQTSANSSFEPVRSHGVGVKPVEVDRANMVGELRENHSKQNNSKTTVTVPAASPGNLEQPPDNMETFFTPHLHPLPLTTTDEAVNVLPHGGGTLLENVPVASEKRSSRVQGSTKKCESPATTLWAQNELPNFGGNVLLAPAAPALYVPPKTQASEIIQPPDEGLSSLQPCKPGSVPIHTPPDGNASSENLENPPKMGEEEALQSQVTKDVQHQIALDKSQPEALPPQPQGSSAAQLPKTVSDSSNSGNQPDLLPSGNSPQLPSQSKVEQQQLSQSSSIPTTSAHSGQPASQQEQQWPPLQTPQNTFGPPQNLSAYYYYRHLYDTYQPQYPPPYPSDPRTASLYYPEDAYGPYDPRYRHYDKSAAYAENYRYAEPERPSSRASHCSDRPSSRQGYPEGYYASKGGWSSHSDYYANYYSGQYDYGDTNRWERYQYDPRFRDPRSYDRRYWYDTEHDHYRKEAYPYGDRPERYDDHWRYDPRFTGSFDDDPEPHREPYDDDRRSIHSEHSAHSLHSTHSLQSRQSSFSSRSHQSQVYRNNDVTANSYERPAPPGSLHGDYSYGIYGNNFSGAQGFTDYGYPAETGWPTSEQVPSRPTTPEKFSVPHVCARFGPGGHLIKVLPNLPSEGQPALVEIHSMETMLQHTAEQEEMRSFPGPLAKDDTHKVDVINFAQNKATECLRNENLIDKESASLLWDFIVLLCRQNGTVVGTDIAELLLRDHKTVWLPGKSPNEANLIDFTNEAVEQVEEEESGEAQLSFLTDSLITTIDSLEKETERFRELLLYGRKKDALESAMKHGLWGHALLLASKMDSRTHARVMTRFANSLPINDPLQTVYQLMSGRMPAASTCCGDEKWGDWRPHLAMVLSNLTNNMDVESRTIATMGDTLASKGLLDAAHFCYLMAQIGFGVYTKKTTKLVLIGSNHSLPFLKFATNEAIHRTEAYEYAQSLGTQPCFLPNFQVFKFIYACRLAEMGLAAQAFHYCEIISKTILKQPRQYSPVLISQLIQIASQLRLFDPQIKEKPEQESFIEPTWLIQLQQLKRQIEEGDVIWNQDRATPHQYPSTPSSELEQYDGTGHGQEIGPGPDNPLLASLLPNTEQSNQNIHLMPSAPQSILENSSSMPTSFHQEKPDNVPFYPVPPGPIGHAPVYGPPVSVPGFSDQYGPEHAAVYPGPNVSPGGQSLQVTDQLPEESRNQDTGRMPQESSIRNSISEQREEDFSGKFANMAPGRRSRTTSQSSAHMDYSRKCQNTESYKGRERSNSAGQQPSPPPFASEVKRPTKEVKKDVKEPKKSGESWFSRWLHGKKKTEAYLPDDTNKSIVWDGKKQRWVNLDEPEEESKPPPPPPTSFPKLSQVVAPPGPGGSTNTSVNMFSRKAAGTRARYVDVLNPNGTKQSGPVPAPSDLFAPLAPLPIPSNLFVPNSANAEEQPLENSGLEGQSPDAYQPDPEPATEPQLLNSATLLPGSENSSSNMDGRRSGELSRCSSMSSLSREVSQHFNQPPNLPPSGGATVGTVPFYNPSQFAQPSAATGSSRLGRIGQRKYPTLK